MNLILTDKCTNSCPYCFAAREMSLNASRSDMIREDFDRFMHFVNASKEIIDLNVIGGDPLLYPDLDYVMRALFNSSHISEIYLMTGGIINPSRINGLLPFRDKTRLMFNVNEKESYLVPSHQRTVCQCIHRAVSLGFRVCLGFNAYHHDFHGDEIIDLCNQFGITHLRFAVACPIYGQKGRQLVVPTNEYGRLSNHVFDFLESCFHAEIEVHLDCPVPCCFFSDEQWGKLAKMHPNVVSRMGTCTPPIDINHDLSLMRCFSLGGGSETKYLTDFHSFEEIKSYFVREMDSRLRNPSLFPACSECPFRERCNGGCLSNNTGFLALPNKTERVKVILDSALSGDVDNALLALKEERKKEDVDYLLLAKLSLVAGDREGASRYIQTALHESHDPEFTREAVSFYQTIKQ